MISYIRSHLSLKLFFSYLVVILVFACVLSVSVYLAAPQAFNRHMLNMQTAEGQGNAGHDAGAGYAHPGAVLAA